LWDGLWLALGFVGLGFVEVDSVCFVGIDSACFAKLFWNLHFDLVLRGCGNWRADDDCLEVGLLTKQAGFVGLGSQALYFDSHCFYSLSVGNSAWLQG